MKLNGFSAEQKKFLKPHFMFITDKEIKELQDGELVFKGDLVIFDSTVNVWQTMNREQLGCDDDLDDDDEKLTTEEFKKRCATANEIWADGASERARDAFDGVIEQTTNGEHT